MPKLNIKPSAVSLKFSANIYDDHTYRVEKILHYGQKTGFKNPAIITITSGLQFDNDAYSQGIVNGGFEVWYLEVSAGDDRN